MTRTASTNRMDGRMMAWGAGAAVVVAGGAMAGPPNADQISEQAKVMVHIDLDAMNDSMIGDMLLSRLEADSNNFEELREIFPGFTLRAQGGLHGLTAYAGGLSNDGPKDMVLLISGDANLKDWNQNLGEMLAEHGGETIDINGHSTLAVPMDDETGYLTLLKNGDDDYTWVFGQSVVSLTEGLGVLAGEKPAVEGEVRERIERRQKSGTIAMFGTARLEIFEEMEQASAFLNLANQVWGKVGESEGRAFAEVTVHTNAEEKANQLVTVYKGAVAFGSVLAQGNEELAEAMAMVQAFKVWAKDGYFTIAFDYDAEELIEFIEAQAEAEVHWDDNENENDNDIEIDLGDDEI
ncbi:MAG: hypothetical protein ACI89L_001630 [Phycisphaerales bacterium]|jgi:hypothetical protein